MYVAFACQCGASFEVDSYQEEEANTVWDMAQRFVESHTKCGFVSKATLKDETKVMNLHFGVKKDDEA
jgi:hypothetical protein